MANNLAHPKPNHGPTAPVKRWQRHRIGELWQLDATPHRWFPNCPHLFPMINMLDDCSRVLTGSKIYERELLLSYLDFLPAAFIECGLPLEIYVDFHSLFFAHDPHALTQLGQALHFYGISFRYAPTPQAKGYRVIKLWTGYAHLRLLVAEVGLRSGKRTSDCGVTNLMIRRKIADLTFECFECFVCFECHTHE
jgi:hypothetical protein